MWKNLNLGLIRGLSRDKAFLWSFSIEFVKFLVFLWIFSCESVNNTVTFHFEMSHLLIRVLIKGLSTDYGIYCTFSLEMYPHIVHDSNK